EIRSKHPKGTHDKGRIAEEPGEGKLSSPVLEQRWVGRLTHRLSQIERTQRRLRDPQGAICQRLVCGLWTRRNRLLPGVESPVEADQSTAPLCLCEHQPRTHCADV